MAKRKASAKRKPVKSKVSRTTKRKSTIKEAQVKQPVRDRQCPDPDIARGCRNGIH